MLKLDREAEMTEILRRRFSADHQNVRLFIELLHSGWMAGVYDLKAHEWLWTDTVSDPNEGKRLILERQDIDPQEITWTEYQPLPTPEN